MLQNEELHLLLFKGKKRKFTRINLLLENFLFVCVFFEIKNICSHTHSTYAGGQMTNKFSPGSFPETKILVLVLCKYWSEMEQNRGMVNMNIDQILILFLVQSVFGYSFIIDYNYFCFPMLKIENKSNDLIPI